MLSFGVNKHDYQRPILTLFLPDVAHFHQVSGGPSFMYYVPLVHDCVQFYHYAMAALNHLYSKEGCISAIMMDF